MDVIFAKASSPPPAPFPALPGLFESVSELLPGGVIVPGLPRLLQGRVQALPSLFELCPYGLLPRCVVVTLALNFSGGGTQAKPPCSVYVEFLEKKIASWDSNRRRYSR